MAKHNVSKNNVEKDPEVVIETAIDKTENFIYRNGKTLLIAVGVVVLAVGGYFGYKYLYSEPRAEKASAMMFVAQQQFAQNEFDKALNGDGVNPGFLDVISKYGSSPAANLAQHYVGICYLKAGELDKALTHFTKYKTTEGAPNAIVNARNFGLMGDIYSQQGAYDKAAAEYRRAVEAGDNVLTAPQYLKKLGLVLAETGKPADAVAALQKIKDLYPASMEARDIDKLIGQFEQK